MNDEEILDELEPADVERELWPVAPEKDIREFEDYLEEIGLRF